MSRRLLIPHRQTLLNVQIRLAPPRTAHALPRQHRPWRRDPRNHGPPHHSADAGPLLWSRPEDPLLSRTRLRAIAAGTVLARPAGQALELSPIGEEHEFGIGGARRKNTLKTAPKVALGADGLQTAVGASSGQPLELSRGGPRGTSTHTRTYTHPRGTSARGPRTR